MKSKHTPTRETEPLERDDRATSGAVAESQPAPAEPAASAPAGADELAQLRQQVEELKAKNLRLLADAQNATKRAERDKQEAIRYAEADMARELLPVLDDLERSLESLRGTTTAGAADEKGAPAAVGEGVRIMYENFLKVLKAHNIVPIEAVGRPFDPELHEALLQQPSGEHPPGTVLQEVARGYRMHERVLRPTRVIVSAAPPGSA